MPKNVCIICSRGEFRGGGGGGGPGFRQTSFGSKFHFYGIFWINLNYHIKPKCSHPYFLPYISLQQVNFVFYECVKIANCVCKVG